MTELISSVAKRADELHPMAAKVARASARQKPLCECTAEEARAMREMLGNPFAPPSCEMESIKDHWLPSSGGELRVRRYHPKSLSLICSQRCCFFMEVAMFWAHWMVTTRSLNS